MAVHTRYGNRLRPRSAVVKDMTACAAASVVHTLGRWRLGGRRSTVTGRWSIGTPASGPSLPAEIRALVVAARIQSHRLLRVFEALRAAFREDDVDRLYRQWGAWGAEPAAWLRRRRSAVHRNSAVQKFCSILAAPSRIRTCAHRSGGPSCLRLLPGKTRPDAPDAAQCELVSAVIVAPGTTVRVFLAQGQLLGADLAG